MTRGRIAVHLFLFFFALYALTSSGNPFRVPDEFEVYFQAEQLVDAGEMSVPQTLAIAPGGQPIFFGRFGLDGRPYAPYGPGIAFLVLPFHLAGRAVAAFAGMEREPLPGGIAWELVVGGITTFASAFAAALAVLGVWRAALTLGAGSRRALAVAAATGVGTALWPYGTTLYSEAWLAALFAWTAALLLEARQSASPRGRVAAAAMLVAIAVITKPTAVVILPGFFAGVLAATELDWRTRLAALGSLGAGAALAAGVHVWWNLARFGSALEFGYNLGAMIPIPPVRPFIVEQVPWGLFVQLLTPGKSLFVWAPIGLVTLLAARAAFGRHRSLMIGLGVSTLTALIFYAAFFLPEGGYSHGPRHLVPLMPLLALPLALPHVAVPRRGFAIAVGFGLLMSAGAVTVSFFEDQSGVVVAGRASSPYYDRIDPEPGRPAIRYRSDYIPFRHAVTSPRWLHEQRPVGEGPDFLAIHISRARSYVPGGAAIPAWLPVAVSLPWLLLLVVSGYALAREWKSTMNRSNA